MIFYDNHQKGMIRIFNAIIGCYYTIIDWFKRVLFISCKHYLGTEQWYDQVARSRPPKNQPWYHVLVDNAVHQTYVAERNLENSIDIAAIRHPMLQHYFTDMQNGYYQLRTRKN